MDVEIFEADVAPMQIQGPRSKDVMRDLLGDVVADLRYYFCAEGAVDGIPVVVSRTGWTGEVGYEIYLCDTTRGNELFDRVMQAGEPYGARVIAPSEARRIEAGIFNYGSDMRVTDTPFHVTGLEKYVELDQPHEFIGRAELARIAEVGVDRKLVGIEIGGAPMTDEGALNDFWPVRARGGDRIGRVSAGAWSPRLEKNVGFAWVPSSHEAVGTELDVDSSAGTRQATVRELPFWDPKKQVPVS
jgi:glycine cleavage system aminomethyltransferase T